MTNNLIKNIENAVMITIGQFISDISEKYKIDKEEIISLWKKIDTNEPVCSSRIISRSASIKTDNDSVNEDGCPYIYTKGEKQGEVCNIKPKGSAVYCTRHKKYEGVEPKQIKSLPAVKKSISSGTTNTKKPVEKIVNTVLRKNKAIDKLWHESTGMVFKSAKERVVIGKCVNDTLLPLSHADIEVCMSHNFAYEKEDTSSEKEILEKKSTNETDEGSHRMTFPMAKKTIASALSDTRLKGESVEKILHELQIKSKTNDSSSSSDEELLEEDDEDE